jgi:hypothetical protein
MMIQPKTLFSLFSRNTSGQEDFVHPWDTRDMEQCAGRLGITTRQLNDAVLDTGSLRLKDIRSYLKQKGVLFSFRALFNRMLGM